MHLEPIHTEGLGHLSYVVADSGQALVIDPRRDVDVYVDVARQHGATITHVIETHAQEDMISGARTLAERTGAEVYHGAGLNFTHGQTVHDGDVLTIGRMELRIMATPGHTPESIVVVLADTAASPDPVVVFTGDTLLVGGLGRSDLLPEQAETLAGHYHESLFDTLLSLHDGVIVMPGHGSGTLCGATTVDRPFSTIGYERRHNPALQHAQRDDFIRWRLGQKPPKPPHFARMRETNRVGPADRPVPRLLPRNHKAFAETMDKGTVVVDVRSPEAFAGAHIPGSLYLPVHLMIPFANWIVPADTDLALVAENQAQADAAALHLYRLGFDRLTGYLQGGLTAWETAGRPYEQIRLEDVQTLAARMEGDQPFTLLDVRNPGEVQQRQWRNAQHIVCGEIVDRAHEVPKDRPVVAVCRTGQRGVIAASVLRRQGHKDVAVCLGSLLAADAQGINVS